MSEELTKIPEKKQFVKVSEDVKEAASNIVQTSQILKDGSADLAPMAIAVGVGLLAFAAATVFGKTPNDNNNNKV